MKQQDELNNPVSRIINTHPSLTPFGVMVGLWLKHETEATTREIADALDKSYTQTQAAVHDLEESGAVKREKPPPRTNGGVSRKKADKIVQGRPPDVIVWVG